MAELLVLRELQKLTKTDKYTNMRKDIITWMAVLTFGVGIAQTNIVKEGYYQVIVSDTVYSQHS